MTEMDSHKINCPKCGHLQDTVVWSSLNVSLNPNLKDELFNGEINVFVCQECGDREFINTSLLYHDMERQYCVQYYPVKAIEDAEFLKGFTKDGNLNFEGVSEFTARIERYIKEPHIVFSLDEMVRYIRFRDKLYDLHKELVS